MGNADTSESSGSVDTEPKEPAPWDAMEFLSSASHGIDYAHVETTDDSKSYEELKCNGESKTLERFSTAATTATAIDPDMQRLARVRSMVQSSADGVKAEHHLGFVTAVKLYWKAIGWSLVLSATIIMEGYDLTIVNSFFAFPQFVQAYGYQLPDGSYEIAPSIQSALTNGAIVGEILGLLINGYLIERFGHRQTLLGALLLLCAFIFLAFFSTEPKMLLASEVLSGLSWGCFQTLSTTYASDILPVRLRAYLTSNVNLCWLIGQLVGIGVLRGFINLQSVWSFKIPFALQWMWAIPIFVLVLMAPESPWWLIRNGKTDKAKKALARLTTPSMNFNADECITLMKKTNEIEKDLSEGTSYFSCFQGVNLRRTEIACMVWATQTLCGSPLTGWATYFYRQAGFEASRAFDLSLGMYGLAIIGNVISWVLLSHIGRRTSYLLGTGSMFVVLMVTGIVGSLGNANYVSWTLGSLLILLTFLYDLTIGPVCYSIVAEIPSTRLRVKTVVLARVTYNIVGIVSNILMPEALNPSAWNWRGKTAFLWAGTCLLCFVWTYFRLPEPKGLTFLELDLLFAKKIGARKFKRVQHTLLERGYFDIGRGEGRRDTWTGNSCQS